MVKTKPREFEIFHKALMISAPEGFIPWYFPVVEGNKAPDGKAISKKAPYKCLDCNADWIFCNKTKRWECPICFNSKGNWKAPWARLTYEESLERLKEGKNIGIAARRDDPLVLIDIDSFEKTNLMPDTLIASSRKKIGFHGFCFYHGINKINIPTEFGEVRASDQYVVGAGSFCTTSEHDIKSENLDPDIEKNILNNPLLGVYTVVNPKSPIDIRYEDLPDFFQEAAQKVKDKPVLKSETVKPLGKHSALFDLTINNIISIAPGRREPHPLHSSDTGMNFSLSGGLAHCWRHSVSLNPIQFLVVKSGYMSCLEAGTGHKNSGAGGSRIVGDKGAIFHAWIQAKKDGLIPNDDPIPVKAMYYIAKEHKLIDGVFEILPVDIYNKVIQIVEEKY